MEKSIQTRKASEDTGINISALEINANTNTWERLILECSAFRAGDNNWYHQIHKILNRVFQN